MLTFKQVCESKDKVRFDTLERGDTFELDGYYYIKTDEKEYPSLLLSGETPGLLTMSYTNSALVTLVDLCVTVCKDD